MTKIIMKSKKPIPITIIGCCSAKALTSSKRTSKGILSALKSERSWLTVLKVKLISVL